MIHKYVRYNNESYYLIDFKVFNGELIELYESTTYGEDKAHLLVNANEQQLIGYAFNGLEDYKNEEHIKL